VEAHICAHGYARISSTGLRFVQSIALISHIRFTPREARSGEQFAKLERLAFNGSLRPHRLARPRTPPFHGDNRGSNPLGDAKVAFSIGIPSKPLKSNGLAVVPDFFRLSWFADRLITYAYGFRL
jgi:hypothetical protein